MKLAIDYEYSEDVVPKRCRIPRPERFSSRMQLTIPEVTAAEAPIALRQHGSTWDEKGERLPFVTDYRWWSNHLWKVCRFQRVSRGPWETQTAEQMSADPWPYCKHTYKSYRYGAHRREVRRDLMRFARSVLIIDGMRWERSSEPRFVITTHGLGHNHGGTSLWACDYYNSNIPNTHYFRADEAQRAVDSAVAIALGRGDDQSVEDIKEELHTFEVLLPEAIRLHPIKEHGQGDPFLNKLDAITANAPDTFVAGLLVMTEGMKAVTGMRKEAEPCATK